MCCYNSFNGNIFKGFWKLWDNIYVYIKEFNLIEFYRCYDNAIKGSCALLDNKLFIMRLFTTFDVPLVLEW
jgi:hypothetical protein